MPFDIHCGYGDHDMLCRCIIGICSEENPCKCGINSTDKEMDVAFAQLDAIGDALKEME